MPSSSTRVTLRPVGLTWIRGSPDDPHDLCAHAHVDFRIDDEVLVDPDKDLEITVSAAALYLLRTLTEPHEEGTAVGRPLFPCCGFSMYATGDSPNVLICGCPSGLDFEVLAEPDGVLLRAGDGRAWQLTKALWEEAVLEFSDAVSAFYAACSPKQPSKDDVEGFRAFTSEWKRRRGTELGRIG